MTRLKELVALGKSHKGVLEYKEIMDYLSDIIVSTRSRHFLNERLEELESEGLFPLPDKLYTKKYILFSRMMKSSTGRGILLLTLPMFSKRTNNY